MSIKLPGQKVISVSLPQTLLSDIDARAGSLGLSRSAYLSLLARQDISNPGPPSFSTPKPEISAATAPPSGAGGPQPARPIDLTAQVYDFLLTAIPALQQYEASKTAPEDDEDDPSPEPAEIEAPPDLAESKLWQFFLLERDQILRLKWLESENVGHDIGLSHAIQIWLQRHRALWIAGQQAHD